MGNCFLPVFFGGWKDDEQARNWTQRGQGTERNGQEAPEAWDLCHDSEPVHIIPLRATDDPKDDDEAKASEPRAEVSRRAWVGVSSDRAAISGEHTINI